MLQVDDSGRRKGQLKAGSSETSAESCVDPVLGLSSKRMDCVENFCVKSFGIGIYQVLIATCWGRLGFWFPFYSQFVSFMGLHVFEGTNRQLTADGQSPLAPGGRWFRNQHSNRILSIPSWQQLMAGLGVTESPPFRDTYKSGNPSLVVWMCWKQSPLPTATPPIQTTKRWEADSTFFSCATQNQHGCLFFRTPIFCGI